jgi:SHS family lactate transporter-like MFS transporter
MNVFEQLKTLPSKQWSTLIACFLGWTLDAFDFFILVFVIEDKFGTNVTAVTFTLFVTLAMRPLGAFLFGVIADRYGRRLPLMANILFYSFVEFACGFAPSLTVMIVLRALFGIAMGGEWGVGAALTMETIAPQTRGFVSGLLQAGYPTGYLLATIVSGCCIPLLDGAGCSWSAFYQRCSFFTSAPKSRSRRRGSSVNIKVSRFLKRSFSVGRSSFT